MSQAIYCQLGLKLILLCPINSNISHAKGGHYSHKISFVTYHLKGHGQTNKVFKVYVMLRQEME